MSPRLTLPALLLALSACTSSVGVADCPGFAVAAFDFVAQRAADGAGCAAVLGPPDYTGAPPDFAALYPLSIPAQPTRLTVAFATQGGAVALCTGTPGATPFSGTRGPAAGGEAVTASVETSGAVLTGCAASCSVTVRQVIDGVLLRDPVTGAVTSFSGTLTETDTALAGSSCTPCVAPCTATYTFDLTPVTP